MENVGIHYLDLVSFEYLKYDWSQTWVKDAVGVPLYVNEVKGHVPRSKSHLRSSYVENVKCFFLLGSLPMPVLE